MAGLTRTHIALTSCQQCSMEVQPGSLMEQLAWVDTRVWEKNGQVAVAMLTTGNSSRECHVWDGRTRC